jgi:hypothetical protein
VTAGSMERMILTGVGRCGVRASRCRRASLQNPLRPAPRSGFFGRDAASETAR